jgi:conjugative transfer region protein TrbK
MDGKVLTRIGAVIAIAIAMTAAVVDLARRDVAPPNRPSPAIGVETPRTDPLRESLVRCQGIGEAATRDPDCLAAWAENRRRFLGLSEGR